MYYFSHNFCAMMDTNLNSTKFVKENPCLLVLNKSYTTTNICCYFSRKFISGLPDKGRKAKEFHDQIEIELNKRRCADRLCEEMALLNINEDQLDTLEWTGKHEPRARKNSRPHVDDDGNVLKIFVSHSGNNKGKIIIKYEAF